MGSHRNYCVDVSISLFGQTPEISVTSMLASLEAEVIRILASIDRPPLSGSFSCPEHEAAKSNF